MNLKELQSQIDRWIAGTGVGYYPVMTNNALLMEEVGELSRLLARNFGGKVGKKGETDGSIEDELADVFWVLVCLANQMNIDLEKAMHDNLHKKITRDKDRFKP